MRRGRAARENLRMRMCNERYVAGGAAASVLCVLQCMLSWQLALRSLLNVLHVRAPSRAAGRERGCEHIAASRAALLAAALRRRASSSHL